MRKKSLYRFISLAMVVAMCLTLLSGPGLTASAEGTGNVTLTIQEELLLTGSVYESETYTDPDIVTVVGDSNCTVDTIQWTDGYGTELTDNVTLLSGNYYYVYITMKEAVSNDTTVTLNNEGGTWRVIQYNPLKIEWSFEPNVINIINDIHLTDVTEPESEGSVSDYSYTDPDGQYTATGTWSEWDEDKKEYKPAEGTFGSTDFYYLDFTVTPSPGYRIADNVTLSINGKELNNYGFMDHELTGQYYFNSSSVTAIEEVVFNEARLPVANVGESYSESFKHLVSDSEQYQIVAYWIDEDPDSDGGTFTKALYHLQLEIYAKEGYYFADEVLISTDSDAWWRDGNTKVLFHVIDVSLETPIEEVVLTKVPVAELGKTLTSEEFALEVPADAKYTASAYWSYYDEENESYQLDADTTVKSGMKYILSFMLEADPGYRLADEFVLVINGITYREQGGCSRFYKELPYSFLTQIPRAEVTGVTEPAIGAVPSYDSLKAAEPEKYEIVETVWYDCTMEENQVRATSFEDGHAYRLIVELKVKSGYEFVPYTPYKLAGFSGISYNSDATDTIFIESDTYSFETVIPDIRISNVPAMVIGKTANTDIRLPDDAKYEASAEWYVWNDESEEYDLFTGEFEKGKTYQLILHASPKTGYRFDKDTTVWYQDGTQIASAYIDNNYASNQIDYPQEGAKLIRKVELSIDEPKTGQHTSVPPTVKLLNGTGCHVDDTTNTPFWLMENVGIGDGYFLDGRTYGVDFRLIADKGYVFAEDLIIVINGISIPADAIDRSSKDAVIQYYFNMTCEHVYDNDSDSTCNICGYNRSTGEIPNTGDSLPLGMYFAVMMASAAAVLGVMVSNKKKKIK